MLLCLVVVNTNETFYFSLVSISVKLFENDWTVCNQQNAFGLIEVKFCSACIIKRKHAVHHTAL